LGTGFVAATTGGVGVGVVCCTCVVDGCDCWQEIMTELEIATNPSAKYLCFIKNYKNIPCFYHKVGLAVYELFCLSKNV
jgi:hypothetical protein